MRLFYRGGRGHLCFFRPIATSPSVRGGTCPCEPRLDFPAFGGHHLLEPPKCQFFLIAVSGVLVPGVAVFGPAEALEQRELLATVAASRGVVAILSDPQHGN